MKKVAIILMALILLSFSITSCRKAKEPESTKQTPAQKEEIKPETKPEVQPTQQPPAAPVAKEEKPHAMEPSPLTEEEQKFIEEMEFGPLNTPNAFKSKDEATRYLKILIKGNHRNVRFFQKFEDKERAQREYGIAIESALSVLNPTKKENFELIIRVMKEKRDYSIAVALAIKKLKGSGDKRVIELDKELIKHPDAGVRLEAAGALLVEGYPDTALPVLDELAKEGSTGALYYLFSKPGKIIDERGYAIVEKALNHPKAEVKISAVKLLLDAKKITKERAEEMALATLTIFKSSKEYGIGWDDKRGIIPLPGFEKDFEKSNQQQGSDWRAIETAISILVELKSKKAIPALERLARNPDASYLQNRANDALVILKK